MSTTDDNIHPQHEGCLVSEDEIRCLPEDGFRYERVDGRAKALIGGVLHAITSPLVMRRLHEWKQRPPGYLLGCNVGYRMSNGNLRCPDGGFMLSERLPRRRLSGDFPDGAPDLALEVIVAGEDWSDMERKSGEYFASGAQQVWQVFPETWCVSVYTSEHENHTYGPDGEITGVGLLEGFECRVADLFAWPRLEED